MNKAKVVFHLVSVIHQRFRGASPEKIEEELLSEGWAIGAIREALDAAP
ncbi:MAG: hypothetical protein AAGL19_05645 [Pseudomonadota bacterium]